jgi:hypothetical protein
MNTKSFTIAISDFLRGRLDASLPYSHFDGSEEELLERVHANFAQHERGYRPGVLVVPVDAEGFHSPVCDLQEGDKIVGEFKARRSGEAPRISIGVEGGKKTAAKACSIILYSRETLEEGGDPSTGADYDCIMIQARAQEGDEPMHPSTLMHNHFGSDGGTDTKMSPEEKASNTGSPARCLRDRS